MKAQRFALAAKLALLARSQSGDRRPHWIDKVGYHMTENRAEQVYTLLIDDAGPDTAAGSAKLFTLHHYFLFDSTIAQSTMSPLHSMPGVTMDRLSSREKPRQRG